MKEETRGHVYYDSIYMKRPELATNRRQSVLVIAREHGDKFVVIVNRYEIYFWSVENVLELDVVTVAIILMHATHECLSNLFHLVSERNELRNQVHKDTYHIIPFIWHSRKGKTVGMETTNGCQEEG